MADSSGLRITPTKDEVLDLATKAFSAEVSYDGKTVPLLVPVPSTLKKELSTGRVASVLHDKATRNVALMMLRPLILERFHSRSFVSFWSFEDFPHIGTTS